VKVDMIWSIRGSIHFFVQKLRSTSKVTVMR